MCGSRAATACTSVFFFKDTAPTEIYTLSLHDALPISSTSRLPPAVRLPVDATVCSLLVAAGLTLIGLVVPVIVEPVAVSVTSEDHTPALQSRSAPVYRLMPAFETVKVWSPGSTACTSA